MGRIRPGFVKRRAEELLETNREKFTNKFSDNKIALADLAEFPTKKLRNLVAGYITKEMSKTKQAS